jgi:hypothetical protein
MIHLYNGILCSDKKENYQYINNMDEPEKCSSKWKNQTQKNVLWMNPLIDHLEKIKS